MYACEPKRRPGHFLAYRFSRIGLCWRQSSETDKDHLVSLVLSICTFALFASALYLPFYQYDDPAYLLANLHVRTGLTLANIKWAFTTLNGDTSYWHPLTWISHQLDCQLFGAAAGAHHLTNVLFHVANVVLVFLFLNRALQSRAKSAFAAAIFAVHPLHLESVLWIAERKDLLCGVFYFLALLTYLSYARKRGLWRYLLTLFFFACSLLSKPMAVSLPCILLLLDIW